MDNVLSVLYANYFLWILLESVRKCSCAHCATLRHTVRGCFSLIGIDGVIKFKMNGLCH